MKKILVRDAVKQRQMAATTKADYTENLARVVIRVSLVGTRGAGTDRLLLSPDSQLASARTFCDSLGLPVDVEASMRHQDLDQRASKAGSWMTRPGLQAHLEAARNKEYTDLVFPRLDRSARNQADFWRLIEAFSDAGIKIHFADGSIRDLNTSEGKLIAGIQISMAEKESQKLGENVSAAIEARWRSGKPHATIPGWLTRKHNVYTRDERGWTSYRALVSAALTSKSYIEIARKLNEAGHRSARNCLWTHAQVRNLMSPASIERMLGTARSAPMDPNNPDSGIVIPNAWEPLINESEAAAMALLYSQGSTRMPRRATNQGGRGGQRHGTARLLSGILFCSVCGHKMNASHSTGSKTPDSKPYETYACKRGREGEPLHVNERMIAVHTGHLDAAVFLVLQKVTSAPRQAEVEHRAAQTLKLLKPLPKRTIEDIEREAMQLMSDPDLPEWMKKLKVESLDTERTQMLEEQKRTEYGVQSLAVALEAAADEKTKARLTFKALVTRASYPHEIITDRGPRPAVLVTLVDGLSYYSIVRRSDYKGEAWIIAADAGSEDSAGEVKDAEDGESDEDDGESDSECQKGSICHKTQTVTLGSLRCYESLINSLCWK